MRLEDLDLPVAVPVPMATPPVNRVLDLEAPRDVANNVNDVVRDMPPPPRPETSLELIEAELAELRRLEFEATGSIPREFETLASATSLDSAPLDFRAANRVPPGLADDRLDPRRTLSLPVEQKVAEKKKKPKPLPVVDLRPKPRAKPREPWGPPPAPPKTKWKRNSLDREAVAALREEKAREKARASSPSSPGPGPEPSVSMDANVLTSPTSPRSGTKKKKGASSSADANAAAEGAFVDAAEGEFAPAGKQKKPSVFKSAYKSLKRAAGIPSKKERAAAKQAAKQAAREKEKALFAAGPGGR